MESIQINGQKIWGPPSDWEGPPPPYGTEVYVRNIPDDVSGPELCHIFSTVGKIYQVRLPVGWNGVNKGFGFVRFTSVYEADAAIERLHMCPIRHGRQIAVERSFDNTRLYLSGVPKEKSGEEIKNDLLTVVDNVKTVYTYLASENPSLYRGYAFAEFVCHRDAAVAKRILTQDVLFSLFEKKCNTSWAKPLPFLNKDELKQVKVLFMRNIPNDVKTMTVKMTVNIITAPDTVQKIKRNKDYAFLTFVDHEAAERALQKLKVNPYLLGSKEIQMEWAIPKNETGASSKSLLTDDEGEQTELKLLRNIGHYPRSKFSDECGTDESHSLEEYQNLSINSHLNRYPFESPRNVRAKEFDSYQSSQSEMHYRYHDLLNQFQGLQMKRSITKGSNLRTPPYSPDSELSSNWSNFDANYKSFTGPMNEFRVRKTEERNREMHVNRWLQSLSPQPSSPTFHVDYRKNWNGCGEFTPGKALLGL